MSDFDKEFWEEFGKNGKVPFDKIEGRIAEVLEANPAWAELANSPDTTLLYSGGFNYNPTLEKPLASATPVAKDLAERANGTVGILDDTKVGSALGDMAGALNDGSLEAKFGDYIDFSKAPITSQQYVDLLETGVKADKFKAWDFSTPLFKGFNPASAEFAKNIEGRIISVTPEARAGAVFHKFELPEILKDLNNSSGKITHVNGMPRSEILNHLKNVDPAKVHDKAFELFNETFANNIRDLNLDIYADKPYDGKVNVLDADQADMRGLGASDAVKMDPPNLKDLNPLDIHGTNVRGAGADNAPEKTSDIPEKSAAPDAKPISVDEIEAGKARIMEANAAEELRGFAADPDGAKSYLVDTKNSQIFTLENGHLTGIDKFDSSKEAGHAFGRLMSEAGQAHPAAFKGLPSVHNSLGALGNHIDDLASPAWRKAVGNAAGEGGRFLGKASKILGPLGVAATGAEAYGLEMKLQDYEEFGLVPEEAMLAYRAILTGHTAQATLDPTLVGGELAVQLAHDEWAKEYGISKEVQEALEPGSLLEDLDAADKWLKAQAAAAGEAVADYAKSRWDNPNLIKDDLERAGDAIVDAGEYVADKAVEAADAVGDYASSRWDDPSKLGDDAKAVGTSISNGAKGAWNYLFGDDEPSKLEQGLQNRSGASTPVPETVPFNEAIGTFANDREALRVVDPEKTLAVSKLAEYPEAEKLFVRLQQDGIVRFPKEALEGDTPQDRVSNILTQARDIDRDLSVTRTAETQTDIARDPLTPNYTEDYDQSTGL